VKWLAASEGQGRKDKGKLHKNSGAALDEVA